MHARPRSIVRPLLAALALVVAAALPARAEDPPPAGSAAGATGSAGSDGWQPVQTQMVQPGESFEAKNLVAAAYGFIWLMVTAFVVTVWRRADRLDKELESLRAQIKAKAGAAPGR